MSSIVACGSEEFTLGFELVGIESFGIDKFDDLISKSSDVGIVIISKEEFDKLSMRVKNSVARLIKPIIIILSKDDIEGGDLREAIIRALGVDLLNK